MILYSRKRLVVYISIKMFTAFNGALAFDMIATHKTLCLDQMKKKMPTIENTL